MALQVLNMSFDSIEFHPLITANINDIGDFNDINSAAEYISEIVLGHKDAFPEFNSESDSKQSQSFKHIDLKKNLQEPWSLEVQSFTEPIEYKFPLSDSRKFLFYKEINPPPPKHIVSCA